MQLLHCPWYHCRNKPQTNQPPRPEIKAMQEQEQVYARCKSRTERQITTRKSYPHKWESLFRPSKHRQEDNHRKNRQQTTTAAAQRLQRPVRSRNMFHQTNPSQGLSLFSRTSQYIMPNKYFQERAKTKSSSRVCGGKILKQ